MFAKLAVVITCAAVGSAHLLALRQARLQAAHELAEAHLRIQASQEILLLLKSDIATRTNPQRLRADLKVELEGFHPVGDEPHQPTPAPEVPDPPEAPGPLPGLEETVIASTGSPA